MHVRMQIKLCAKCKKEIQLRADIIPKKENIIFFFLILTVSCLYFGFFYIFIIFFSTSSSSPSFFFFVLFHTFPLSLSSPFSTFWSLYTLSSAASVFIYT